MSIIELFWVRFLCAYIGYLNLKRIQEKRIEFMWIWVRKRRRKKLGKSGNQVRVAYLFLVNEKILFVPWSGHEPFFLKNLFRGQIFKCFSVSRACFWTLICWLFFLFNYVKTLLNIMISFLTQFTMLECIIQLKES